MVKKTHPTHKPQNYSIDLNNLAHNTIIELETPLGINASGKDDRYAAFFGRDSMISCLKLLKVLKKKPNDIYRRIIRRTIQTAIRMQGTKVNLKSGEKPGKIIHEYREAGFTHLIKRERPWYVYPDNTLRNYDSVDATPLFLILVAEYVNYINDQGFIRNILPTVEKAFKYLEEFSPKNEKSIFLEYLLQRPQPFGGIANQGWMDSVDSILIEGKPPDESIALVEVQGYYFRALLLWSKIFQKIDKEISNHLRNRAEELKKDFNELFFTKSDGLHYYANALFGHKAHILETRSNPGHLLWSSVKGDGKHESIIEEKYIPEMVERLLKPDLFVPGAGIRTLSENSKFFDFCSYHNGSIWPFDNGLITEGFENFGYQEEAKKIKEAVLNAISKFGSAVELYCANKNGDIVEYTEKDGHYGSHDQAWTAATILDFTT